MIPVGILRNLFGVFVIDGLQLKMIAASHVGTEMIGQLK